MKRRTLATVTALAIAAAGALLFAPTASAAGITIDCAADANAGGEVPYTVYASAGETITLTNVGEGCRGSAMGPHFEETSSMEQAEVTFQVGDDTPAGVYSGTLGEWETWDGIVVGTQEEPTSYITVIVGAPGDAGSPPPSSYQQVPMPASGSCTDVKDSGLDYGTGLTGGWTKQWGEWADGGKGAFVCGRTIAWINDAWAIQTSS